MLNCLHTLVVAATAVAVGHAAAQPEGAPTGTPFPAMGTPADAVLGDLVGGPGGGPDGIIDLVIAYPQIPGTPRGGIALLAGQIAGGACSFQPVGMYTGPLVDRPSAVEIGDYDGDGIKEIAFANRGPLPQSELIHLLNANSSQMQPLSESQIPSLPIEFERTVVDLATITLEGTAQRRGPLQNSLIALNNSPLGGTASVSTFDTMAGDWEVCDVDVCDIPASVDPIDPDGPSPLLGEGFASSSTGNDKVVVASNTGVMPAFFPTENFATDSDPTELRADDLNGDGFPDIVVINQTSGTVSVFVNIPNAPSPGGRSFAAGVSISLKNLPGDPDADPSSVALADLDDDGDLDIAFVSTDAAGDRVVRALSNMFIGTGSLTFSAPFTLPEQPDGVPLLVRESQVELTGGIALNDDLVVLVDPSAGLPRSGRGASGTPPSHLLLCNRRFCPADINGDGLLTPADLSAWILAFNQGDAAADQNGDGIITPSDFSAWILNYNTGCGM